MDLTKFLPGGFNTDDAPADQGFEPLPPGEYLVMITDTKQQTTKAGDGWYLNVTMEVLEGRYERRLIWEMLHLGNKNQKAVEIAQRSLAGICRAIGIVTVKDTEELHGKPFKIKLKIEPAKGEYDPKNKIVAYKSATTTAPAAPAAEAPWKGQADAPVRPWEKAKK